jgi:hypothetical protein
MVTFRPPGASPALNNILEYMPKAYSIFAYLTFYSTLIPIFAGIIKFKSADQGVKLVIYFLLFGFLIDSFTFWPILGHKIIPFFSHIFVLVEFVIVLFIFSLWQDSREVRMVIRCIMGAFILFWISAKLTFEPFHTPFIMTAAISAIILTLAAAYTLFIVYENNSSSLLKNQKFWILLSFIFNSSGTLLPIIFAEFLFGQSRELFYMAWSITWFLAIISNVLFTIGFLCPQTQI